MLTSCRHVSKHNSNLVNGDAELVVTPIVGFERNSLRAEIKGQGAINLRAITEAIARVMDGGEKAFKLGAAQYGF